MELLWKKEITLPYTDELFSVQDFQVDEAGDVYVLGRVYEEKAKEKRRGEVNYRYEILAYRDQGESLQQYPVEIEDRFLTDMQVAVTQAGDLLCAGFWSDKGTFSIKGSYFLSVSRESGDVMRKSFEEFGIDFITQHMSERQEKKTRKKEEKGKAPELYQYDLDDIIIHEDGGAVLVGEQYYVEVVTTTTTTGNGGTTTRTTYYYHYNDIIVVRISPEGDILWNQKIPKTQMTRNDGGFYSSYTLATVGSSLFFLFNEKNMRLGKESLVVLVEVKGDGTVEKEALFSSREVDIITVPKACRQVGTEEVILFGKPTLLVVFLALVSQPLSAQGLRPEAGVVYDDASIARIDITIDPDTLALLYDDPWSDVYARAQFAFTRGAFSDSVSDIGLRFRGNFSRGANKKNFKISFNRFARGRKWYGLEKLNVNSQHNDPTIARAKLTSDLTPLARQGILGPEATRAGHVEVWINGDYYGLYINVEHIDEQFAENHFGSPRSNVYKCLYPADLQWSGSSPSSYSYCEQTQMETDGPVDDVVQLVDVLNNTALDDLACAMESVLNVDDYLRQAAVEVVTGHWDGYIYNQNNFYLLRNPMDDRLEYVIYDTDNTWGIDWIGRDWGTRDIYEWAQGSGSRPLYERLLDVPELRDRFSYYLDQLVALHFNPTVMDPQIDALELQISPSAEADPYRPLDFGYGITDFHDAFSMPLSGWSHLDYGLKDYTATRSSTIAAQLEPYDLAPVLNHWRHNFPVLNQVPWVGVSAWDDDPGLELWCWYSMDGLVDSVLMSDDGLHNDGAAGDGRYGAYLPAVGSATDWTYSVHAYGGDGVATRRPCDPEAWRIESPSVGLVVNEMLAANDSGMQDEEGQRADWLEIYNAGSTAVQLSDYFLSDDPVQPAKWRMPEESLAPGAFAWFWMDDDEDDGPNHANFRLDADGGHIGIYAPDQERHRPIWTADYGLQSPDVSVGFLPDGEGTWQVLSTQTPGWSNVLSGMDAAMPLQAAVYPNPVSNRFYIEAPSGTTWRLLSMDGRVWTQGLLLQPGWRSTGQAPTGLYLLQLEHAMGSAQIRIVLE
jgi:spore coat protein CotH